jgi:plasmid stabilization system protein ParE
MGAARSAVRRRRWPVVLQRSFFRDVSTQLACLREAQRANTIETLRDALRAARRLLTETPFLAPADERGVRRLLLAKVPFFLWYRVDEGARTVRWLRLFHVRQRRARG